MSGIWATISERRQRIGQPYVWGYEAMNEDNECADAVIASPDRYLLPKEQLWEAEGGWATCALTIGLGLAGVGVVLATHGKIGTHLNRGNLRFREWALLLAGAGAGGAIG